MTKEGVCAACIVVWGLLFRDRAQCWAWLAQLSWNPFWFRTEAMMLASRLGSTEQSAAYDRGVMTERHLTGFREGRHVIKYERDNAHCMR